MREIKFRAWDKNRNRMCSDFVITADGTPHIIRENDELSRVVNEWYRKRGDDLHGDYPELDFTDFYAIENYEIMQFTGLSDKNGVEIYEGDILNHKTIFENNMADMRFQLSTEVEVGFKNGCFIDVNTHLDLHDKIYAFVSHGIDYEIIGNIYENPDLL